ncbi:drebrin-like protein isoform X3 [Elgaria multicarinata webbii]|uniref:drebrin-like protein isoform X3 n=1 Tax=Elgaria multicarinata webbii TaxID=159646 RepID=UPI002FCCF27A
MGSSAVNLEKHSLALLAAKGDVVSGRAAASWALFAYEKSHELKLLDSGAGGPEELAKRFLSSSIMYGLCRLPDATLGQQRIVLIHWVGEAVPEQRRQACASHLPAIRAFFKEAHLVVKVGRAEEVTQDGLRRMVSLVAPPGGTVSQKVPLGEPQELVGTNYKKTNPALEILHTKRSSFWEQAEREEEERRQEERRRAQEERRHWERQRMEEERREAAERERRVQAKEQLIQEQRKQQARLEAEERRCEEARWEQQQRERALSEQRPPSCSAEKATEAAALASQRSRNPRDFFQPRERSGSTSGVSEPPSSAGGWPGTPRRPFLRYQRSLTESAYIFRRPDPAPGPLPGDFLPSASPRSPPAAPLPSPRQSKPPPAVSPKPGAGPRSPAPVPEGRPPSPLSSPETRAPLPPTLLDRAGAPRTSPQPPAHPLAGAGLQASLALSPPGTGDAPPNGCAAGTEPASSSGSPAGPCRASALPQGSPPPTRSLAPAPLAQPPCLAHSPEVGPAPPSDPPHPGTAPISSACSLLTAPHEEALPHTDSVAPFSFWSSDNPGESSLDAPSQEEDAARDHAPGLAPAPSPAESSPYSGHNGVAALEEGRGRRVQEQLGPEGQAETSVDAKLPEAERSHPGAAEQAHSGNQATVVEHRGDTGGPSLHPAETRAA